MAKIKPIKLPVQIVVKETKELFEKVEAEIKKLAETAKAEIEEKAKQIIKKYVEDVREKD